MKDYNEMVESLFERREKYIAERKKKRNALIKTASGLSCFCLAALSGLFILNYGFDPGTDLLTNITPVAIEETVPDRQDANYPDTDHPDNSGISDLQNSPLLPETPGNTTDRFQSSSGSPAEYGQASPQGSGNPTPGTQASSENSGYDGSHKQNAEMQIEAAKNERESDSEPWNQDKTGTTPDAPVSEQSPGSLQQITVHGDSSDFFGGSYTDSRGLLCILLTEDTPENRCAICKELNLNQNNVVFQNADYTLSYLTELQARISEGMIRRELNFVVVSSLREDTNRIHLTVTTQDASLLEKLTSLDSLGGALTIEYQPNGGMIRENLQSKTEAASP